MEWVKASVRLPKKSGSYFCIDRKWGHKKVLYYTAENCGHGSNSLFKRRPYDIEWLDEQNTRISDCRA